MEDNEIKSQSLSLQVQKIAQWARELSMSCKEGSPKPGGHQGRWSLQSSWAEPPVANAKDQHGMEQHPGVWSLAVSAVVWSLRYTCLSYTLKVVFSTLVSLLITVLALLVPSGEFAQEPFYGWSCSADMAIPVACADILAVSLCQMCGLWRT